MNDSPEGLRPGASEKIVKAYAKALERRNISANDVQINGDHYKTKEIQPWDYIAANGLCFFTGNCVKYVTRWQSKGGIEDLKKARHYLDKLIELETTNKADKP